MAKNFTFYRKAFMMIFCDILTIFFLFCPIFNVFDLTNASCFLVNQNLNAELAELNANEIIVS